MRSLLCVAAVLAALATAVAPAQAAYYRGGGHGYSVEFRVRGREVVEFKIAAALYCRDGKRRHRGRWVSFHGDRRPPADWTELRSSTFRVDSAGRFGWPRERSEEPGFSEESLLSARLRHRAVSGFFRFRYDRQRGSQCQTGGYQAAGSAARGRGTAIVQFRARRQAR